MTLKLMCVHAWIRGSYRFIISLIPGYLYIRFFIIYIYIIYVRTFVHECIDVCMDLKGSKLFILYYNNVKMLFVCNNYFTCLKKLALSLISENFSQVNKCLLKF